MKKILSNLAYTWAFICFILILTVIFAAPQLAKESKKLPFMKINPLYTGGDLYYLVEKDSLKTKINKPVFEALIGEPEYGFVQIEFSGNKKALQLHEQLIDYNKDSKPDFWLKIDTLNKQTEFVSLNPNAESLIVSSKAKDKWIVRVKIRK
jgi:hypothetical protein